MASVSAVRRKERERCAALVKAYRDKIERSAGANIFVSRVEVAKRVSKSLRDIENEILNGKKVSADQISLEGGFSMDEIEHAITIVKELQHNPFEEENNA